MEQLLRTKKKEPVCKKTLAPFKIICKNYRDSAIFSVKSITLSV